MRSVGALEAGHSLLTLLDLVEQGEEVAITRNGRVIAKLSPVAPTPSETGALRAIAETRELRKSLSLAGLSIKEMIDEGRR